LLEQQAIRFSEGWKMIEVRIAAEVPRRSSCKTSPPSEEKILMLVPFVLHVAIKVPSGFTAINPS
jgi:hypothetical protein